LYFPVSKLVNLNVTANLRFFKGPFPRKISLGNSSQTSLARRQRPHCAQRNCLRRQIESELPAFRINADATAQRSGGFYEANWISHPESVIEAQFGCCLVEWFPVNCSLRRRDRATSRCLSPRSGKIEGRLDQPGEWILHSRHPLQFFRAE